MSHKRMIYFDGRRMRAARVEKGLTLDMLAADTGLTKGYLSDLENGNQTNPTLEVMARILNRLHWLRFKFDDVFAFTTRNAPRRSRRAKALSTQSRAERDVKESESPPGERP